MVRRMSETGIVARSSSHFLVRDDEGFSLYSVDQDGDDPLLTFAPDAAGEERAQSAFRTRSRETARLRWLGRAALAAGAVYLLVNIARLSIYVSARANDSPMLFTRADRFRVIIEGVQGFAQAALFVSVGWLLVAWLQRRWRREG